jgi:hypothetical protein
VIPVLPNFLVIGAAKAGTTSLYHYLRGHPQVFMSQRKELNFFVENDGWVKGTSWYERQFEGAGDAVAVGEASPNYSKYPAFPGVPERIAKLIPDVRLIYLIRHPIDRMRSHYLHEVAALCERRPIGRALAADPRYLNTSRYAMQIERYHEHFPRDQLLIITAEQLRHDRTATVRRVLAFLGVDLDWPDSRLLDPEFHRTSNKRVRRPLAKAALRVPGTRAVARLAPRPMRRLARRKVDAGRGGAIPEALEAHLRAELRDDVGRLRAHVGEGFDGWGIG